MVNAGMLVEEIRQTLQAVEARIRSHPYLDALEAARLSADDLRRFAGQQYHIIGSDLRALALLIARGESAEARDFFWGAVQGERAAREALRGFADALGMPAEMLEAAEPIPGAFAYSAYVAWLALFGSTAEFAAAFLVNLEAWGSNCTRMSRALKARYRLREADVRFFDLFGTLPSDFQARALGIIQDGLNRSVEPSRIARAARMLQGYELLYWDTLHQAASP